MNRRLTIHVVMGEKVKWVPLNLNKGGCASISSNCVVWSGPDIPILGLCKGATVTEVVYNLGLQFQAIYEQMDPESYELDCLEIAGDAPETFKEMFQALVDVVCGLLATEPFGGCNISAGIAQNSPTTFGVSFTGATLPVTYQWTIPQTDWIGFTLGVDSDEAVVTITQTAETIQDGTSPSVKISQALLKVKITDKNGCVATDFLLINIQNTL